VTWHIRNAVVLLLALAAFGCGYTILAPDRRPMTLGKGAPNAPRSDLSFSRIDRLEREVRANDDNPRLVTDFRVTVRNEGEGDFDGAVLCIYACSDEDIRHSNYPNHADPFPVILRRGDTAMVTVSIDRWFASGTCLRFKIRTDAYPLHPFDPAFFFGREPIQESSYENNGADYVVK
jgi:hypothetical protein